MKLDELIDTAISQGASDLHLSAGNPPICRINGELHGIEGDALSADDIGGLLEKMMDYEQHAQYVDDLEIDFSVNHGDDVRLRVNAYHDHRGHAAVIRVIPNRPMTLDEIAAPHIMRQLAEIEKGIVIITGPAGSGRSTTLAAMIDHINTRQARHVVTIEDPVEVEHKSRRSLINQRSVGQDTKCRKRAMKSAMREDADVILVGALDEPEIAAMALEAAENGILVLASMHTPSAAKTVERLIEIFPEDKRDMAQGMLAGALQAVIAQVLLRRADGKGRIAGYEILTGTPAIRNFIRENQVPQIYSMMQMGGRFGMQTMADSVEGLAKRGLISESEAWRGVMTSAGEDDPDGAAADDAEGMPLVKHPANQSKAKPASDKKDDGEKEGGGKDSSGGKKDKRYSF